MSKRDVTVAVMAFILLLVILGTGFIFKDSILMAISQKGKELGFISAQSDLVSESDNYGDEWLEYEDSDEVIDAIASQLTALEEAVNNGDVKEASKYFRPELQENFEDVMDDDDEAMKELSTIMDEMKLVYISEPVDEETQVYQNRFAYGEVEYDGLLYTIVLVEVDGDWVIHFM